jgi:hypothetical protein
MEIFSSMLVYKSLQTKGKGDPASIKPRAMKVYRVSWMNLRGHFDLDHYISEKKAPAYIEPAAVSTIASPDSVQRMYDFYFCRNQTAIPPSSGL